MGEHAIALREARAALKAVSQSTARLPYGSTASVVSSASQYPRDQPQLGSIASVASLLSLSQLEEIQEWKTRATFRSESKTASEAVEAIQRPVASLSASELEAFQECEARTSVESASQYTVTSNKHASVASLLSKSQLEALQAYDSSLAHESSVASPHFHSEVQAEEESCVISPAPLTTTCDDAESSQAEDVFQVANLDGEPSQAEDIVQDNILQERLSSCRIEAEEMRQRAEQLSFELESSEMACDSAQRDAQRMRQASALASDEMNERLKSMQSLSQTFRSEYDDSQDEITALTRARHKLQSQLHDCEMSREVLGRRLQSVQSELGDFQMRSDESSSSLRHAQSQGEAMRRELLQARTQAEEVDNLIDVKQQLKSELMQCQSELLESRTAQRQDGIWANQLRQENDQLLADCRAAGMLADSLRRELRDTSDRASAQHAETCDLRVALENSRLEVERLRDNLAVAQRENSMLQRQLQQRSQPISNFSVGACGRELHSAKSPRSEDAIQAMQDIRLKHHHLQSSVSFQFQLARVARMSLH